jgi:hypothetical protein
MSDRVKNEINRGKASNHPSNGVGVFTATVLSIVNGKANITVEGLSAPFLDVDSVGRTGASQLKKGDRVLCTFVNQKTEDLVILGPINKKVDVFSTVVKFNALVDQLETQINTIRQAQSPPLSSISLQAFKQAVV